MRTTWSALYASLHASLTRLSAERHFQAMRADFPDLARFASIAELLTHQGAADGDPALRYHTIRILVAAAQSPADYAQTAHTMGLVALWPGLDAAYRRLWHKYPKARPDLASDLLSKASAGIGGLDLDRVHAVAAALIRNAERDIGRASVKKERLARVTKDIAETAIEREAAGSVEAPRNWAAELDVCLAGLSEPDKLLLKRVLLLGETQAEAGAALGLSHAAARKRFARALARLARP